ncbi:MAG: hypothetical protein BGO31_07355 [Bacteroidetes bacterium 43-16]|nr:MAG: hypothetical protein BGO31_07355 [Bacteroidetes bacterium 43-16]
MAKTNQTTPTRKVGKTYTSKFLKYNSLKKRGDKSIYVRKEYHERLNYIVHILGGGDIPLYAYLDNILEHHFSLFEKAIKEDINLNYKPLF